MTDDPYCTHTIYHGSYTSGHEKMPERVQPAHVEEALGEDDGFNFVTIVHQGHRSTQVYAMPDLDATLVYIIHSDNGPDDPVLDLYIDLGAPASRYEQAKKRVLDRLMIEEKPVEWLRERQS